MKCSEREQQTTPRAKELADKVFSPLLCYPNLDYFWKHRMPEELKLKEGLTERVIWELLKIIIIYKLFQKVWPMWQEIGILIRR